MDEKLKKAAIGAGIAAGAAAVILLESPVWAGLLVGSFVALATKKVLEKV